MCVNILVDVTSWSSRSIYAGDSMTPVFLKPDTTFAGVMALSHASQKTRLKFNLLIMAHGFLQ